MHILTRTTLVVIIFFHTMKTYGTEPFFSSHTREYVDKTNENLEKCVACMQKQISQGMPERLLIRFRDEFINRIKQAYQEDALLPDTCRMMISEYHKSQRNKKKLHFINDITFSRIRPFIINEKMIKGDYRLYLSLSAANPLLMNELLYKYKLLQLSHDSQGFVKRCTDKVINGINYVIGNKIKNITPSLLEAIITDAYNYGFIVNDIVCDGQHPLFKEKRPLTSKNLIDYLHVVLQPNLYNNDPVSQNISPFLKEQLQSVVLSLKAKNIKGPKVLFFYIMDYLKKYNQACHMKSSILKDLALIKKPRIEEIQEASAYLKSDAFWLWFDKESIE